MNNLVSSALLAPFESLINQCIGMDQKLSKELSKHNGKILEIEVSVPSLDIFVFFYQSTVQLRFATEDDTKEDDTKRDDTRRSDNPDGKISGSASALLSILLRPNSDRSLVNRNVKISGDSEFIQEIQILFSDMEIDWQEPLSKLIGDIPTHSVGQLLNKLFSFTSDSSRVVTDNIDEYLHEEIRLVPPLNQIEMFDQELDSLKLKLDRLDARQQLARQQLNISVAENNNLDNSD